MNPDSKNQAPISFSEERFRTILNHTYSWENWISNEGVLLWVNPAVEKFTGFSVAECHQKESFPYCILEKEQYLKVKNKITKGVKSGATVDNIELLVIRKDGTEAWMASTWKPVYSSSGDLIGTWVTFHDVTKLKNTGEKLKKVNQKLRKTNVALNKAKLRVEEATPEQLGHPSQLTGIKILVADDNKYNQLIAKEFIREMGAFYDHVDNGFEVLEKVRLNHYDIILMDIQMPGMDGVEATKLIREIEDPHLKQIPIIAISASAQKRKKDWYLKAGMNGFIDKPFRSEELKNTILRHLEEVKDINASNIPGIDLSALESLSGGDKNFIRYSVGLFLNNVKLLQDHLKDYIRNNQLEEAASLVHQTKPAFVHIGLHKLFDELDLLETKLLREESNGEVESLATEIVDELSLVIPEIKHQLELIGIDYDS